MKTKIMISLLLVFFMATAMVFTAAEEGSCCKKKCTTSDVCPIGQRCIDGTCQTYRIPPDCDCLTDSDCPDGGYCTSDCHCVFMM